MFKQTYLHDYFSSMASIRDKSSKCNAQKMCKTKSKDKGKKFSDFPASLTLLSDESDAEEVENKYSVTVSSHSDDEFETTKPCSVPKKFNIQSTSRKKKRQLRSQAVTPPKMKRLLGPSNNITVNPLRPIVATMQLNTPKAIDSLHPTSHITSLHSNQKVVGSNVASRNECPRDSSSSSSDIMMVDLCESDRQTSSSQTENFAEKFTQSEEECFSANTLCESQRLAEISESQNSDMTEEYDVEEYQDTVLSFNTQSPRASQCNPLMTQKHALTSIQKSGVMSSQESDVVSTHQRVVMSTRNNGLTTHKSDTVSTHQPAIMSAQKIVNMSIQKSAVTNPVVTSPKKNTVSERLKSSAKTSDASLNKKNTKLPVRRNIFNVDALVQTDIDDSDTVLNDNSSNQLRQLKKKNIATQVRSQDIIDEIAEAISICQQTTKTSATDSSKNPKFVDSPKNDKVPLKTPQSNKFATSTPVKTNKKNDEKCLNSVKKNESPLEKKELVKNVKIDKRYSEENHTRLCNNIHIIGNWVLEHFSTLFSSSDVKMFQAFLNLSSILYKAFCLRLYTRMNKWYNMDDICRTLNINLAKGEQDKMLNILVKNGLVEKDYSQESVLTLLQFLNRPQIKEICVASKLTKTPTKKEAMINMLVENTRRQATLSSLKTSSDILKDRVTAKLGQCVKLSLEARNLFDKIHMLYSLANPDLKTPNDIYWQLNKIHFEQIKYPQVKIDSVEIYQTSHELDRYVKARILSKEFFEEMENKSLENCVLLCDEAFNRFKTCLANVEEKESDKDKPLFLRRYSAPWIYCSVISSGGVNLGKPYPNKVCDWLKYLLKQKIYCPNKRGKWYEQLALVKQSHLKLLYDATDHIIAGLSDPLVNEVSKHELSKRGRKIYKTKLNPAKYDELQEHLLPACDPFPSRSFQANIVHDNIPGRKKSYIRTTAEGKEYGSVEETAISFYLDETIYTEGIHCEGRLLSTLFCLLFWDIIYEVHVPNTFISDIQCYPLDMFSGEFYKNRKRVIDQRLNNILHVWTMDTLCAFISKTWHKHVEELPVLIPHNFGDDATLNSIVRCIGARVLGNVCKRFVEDFRLFRAGLPDLFLWNPKEEKCCFVEVKGENDKLSSKQILWLNYLRSVGAKIELCHIQDIGSRSVKKVQEKCPKKQAKDGDN